MNDDPNCSGKYVTKDTPPLKLGFWLNNQRRMKRKSKLPASRINRLKELGVWWDRK